MSGIPWALDGHPSRDQLADFGRGEVDDTQADTIERHLADCPRCVRVLEGSKSDDTWIDLVRAVGSPGPALDEGPALTLGYELEAVIGRGGMGVVHRARQLGLGRLVALKTIAAGRDASPLLLERFRREIEAVASLNHPAIVPIYDVGVRDGVPFYAMELLVGGTLADRLAEGPLRVPDAASLIERLARAIDQAHRQGIIHRDLKPTNILFDAEGAAKIVDFGLAKRLDADLAAAATRSGMFLGTPSYMAPEQAWGDPEAVGPAVDVHALGAVLFECLTGRPPFLAHGPLEALERLRTVEAPSPSQFRPGLPADLETICLKCLQKAPARRYPSAAALADDLGRFSRGEPILARPSGRLGRTVRWARRRPFEAAFAGLLALSAIGTIAGLLAHQARLRAALGREANAAAEAQRQRGVAEANYRDARDAIARMLAALREPKLVEATRLTEIHRAQAEVALGYYEGVLRHADASSPAIRGDTARAAVEAANLQISLGRLEPAEANLARARGLYDALLFANPDDRDLHHERIAAQIKLGVLLQERRDVERSVAALEQARELAGRFAAIAPSGDRRPRSDLAWCEHNLGSSWLIGGHPDRALAPLSRASDIYRRTIREIPDDLATRVELAQTVVNLGLAQSSVGDVVRAEASYREAGSVLDEAVAAHPGVLAYVSPRCELLINWGNLDVAAGRVDAGLARFDAGLREIAPFLKADPNVLRLKGIALNLHGARAVAREKAGRFREAAEDWARVIALEGGGPNARGYLLGRLLCLARGGDHREIAAEAAHLEKQADLPAIDRYNLACALALSSAAAPENSSERQDLRARALKAIELALAGDPHLRDTARQDADLQSLCDDPRFRRAIENHPGNNRDSFR